MEEPLLSDLEVNEEDEDNEYSSVTDSDTDSDTDGEDSVELDMDRGHNVRELQEEQEKNAIFQREQDRLLSVVEMLNGELDGEPEMIEIVNELSEGKFALALERTERERLENIVRQLRSSEEKKKGNAEKKKGLFFGYTPPWPKSPRSPARRSVPGESLTKAPSKSFVSRRSIIF